MFLVRKETLHFHTNVKRDNIMDIKIYVEEAKIKNFKGKVVNNFFLHGRKVMKCIFSFSEKGKTVHHVVIAGFPPNFDLRELEQITSNVTRDLSSSPNWPYSSLFLAQMIVLGSKGELLFNGKGHQIIRSGLDYRNAKSSMGNNSLKGMKSDSQFKGGVLPGLYYRHVKISSPWGLAVNLLNQHNKKKWFDQQVYKILNDGSKTISKEHINKITHAAVEDALEKRFEKREMTGEWLVYLKKGKKNTILSLAAHEEGDLNIKTRVETEYILFG